MTEEKTTTGSSEAPSQDAGTATGTTTGADSPEATSQDAATASATEESSGSHEARAAADAQGSEGSGSSGKRSWRSRSRAAKPAKAPKSDASDPSETSAAAAGSGSSETSETSEQTTRTDKPEKTERARTSRAEKQPKQKREKPVAEKKRRTSGGAMGVGQVRTLVARIVWVVCLVFALALAITALFIALKANSDNEAVRFIVSFADKVDLGIFDLSNPIKDFDRDAGPSSDTKTALFNYGIGAVVWLIIGRIGDRVIRP